MAAQFQLRSRLATALVGGIMIWFSLATIFAESVTPTPPSLLPDSANQLEPKPQAILTHWAAGSAPLRGDLLADLALTLAASGREQGKDDSASPAPGLAGDVEPLVRQSLSFSPHASHMWLLLAKAEPSPSIAAEALKMSYLTSPAAPDLISARFEILCRSNVPVDADLISLARSDIRLALTRRPDLRDTIANLYVQCSIEGKGAIYQIARSLDAGFAASLR